MLNPKLLSILKSLSVIPLIFIIVIFFLFGAVSLSEGYNVFNPYVDTEFAQDYSPEKFKLVKEGMHMRDVIAVTGEPLNSGYDTAKALIYHSYTRDGWLRRGNHHPLSLCGDLAWYGSSVEYNTDSIAIHVYSGWYYD